MKCGIPFPYSTPKNHHLHLVMLWTSEQGAGGHIQLAQASGSVVSSASQNREATLRNEPWNVSGKHALLLLKSFLCLLPVSLLLLLLSSVTCCIALCELWVPTGHIYSGHVSGYLLG